MTPKLICCLGNPGKEYQYTRHNIGFLVGEALITEWKAESRGGKFKSSLYEALVQTQKIIIQFPLTFMNLSGEALQAAVQFHKIPPQNILVLYDDIDIPFGTLRYREKGSAGTHNGMKSIIERSGTPNIPRLRIGIGPKPLDGNLSDFVLGQFSKQEKDQLKTIQKDAIEKIKELLSCSFE